MILLDTHAWVWYIGDPGRLSPVALTALDSERALGRPLLISCISTWEVALLVTRGRLDLTMDCRDWIGRCEALPFLRFIPADNAILLRSVLLEPPLHPDPADRIIAATALVHGATLVTADGRLRAHPGLSTLW